MRGHVARRPRVRVVPPGAADVIAPLQHDDRRDLLDWSAIAELRAFGGIRIEDNIVVEAAGTRNLTREAFAEANRPS
jgi:Xaa-Pro aminopeptidase